MHYLDLLFNGSTLMKYLLSFMCCSPSVFSYITYILSFVCYLQFCLGLFTKGLQEKRYIWQNALCLQLLCCELCTLSMNLKGSFDIRYQFLETPQNCCLFLTQNYVSTGLPDVLSCITDRKMWKYKARWESLAHTDLSTALRQERVFYRWFVWQLKIFS